MSLLLAGCTVTPVLAPSTGPTPTPASESRTVYGVFHLALSEDEQAFYGEQMLDDIFTPVACEGAGGFADIVGGAQVTVLDEDGTILGVGELEDGLIAAAVGQTGLECEFEFEVTDIPLDRAFYSIEVGGELRGDVTFTADEMRRGPQLYLG